MKFIKLAQINANKSEEEKGFWILSNFPSQEERNFKEFSSSESSSIVSRITESLKRKKNKKKPNRVFLCFHNRSQEIFQFIFLLFGGAN